LKASLIHAPDPVPDARKEAPSYPPALYAAVHRGNPGDVDYYRRVCAGVRTVLELGCGWGRIANAVAADGCEVVGLEREGSLRALGAGGAAQLVAGDMRSFDLGRIFDRVIIPYNGIYCLLDEASVRACLQCARAHLAPEGLLVFDGYAGDAFHDDPDATPGWDALEPVARVTALGATWEVHEQSRWDRAGQRIDARYVHVPVDGGDAVEAVIPQRYLLSGQVPNVLAEAGLRLVALQGGFDQSAFDPEQSGMLIAVAARDDAAPPQGC
jgi:SAM-dependent methyltransferase